MPWLLPRPLPLNLTTQESGMVLKAAEGENLEMLQEVTDTSEKVSDGDYQARHLALGTTCTGGNRDKEDGWYLAARSGRRDC